MGQIKQEYLDWKAQQSKCKFCGDAAEDCECSRGQTMFTKGEWIVDDANPECVVVLKNDVYDYIAECDTSDFCNYSR